MGPTASGKSALAIHLAQQFGGVILNADAMQCYDGLPILTAQPTAADKAKAEHRLYSMWEPLSHGHAALWQEAAAVAIKQAQAAGQLPILVGGTGMYVKLLSDGIAPVPEISLELRTKVRAMPVEQAYAELQQHDAAMAARLKPTDTQRIGRALEVVLQTGTSLLEWQKANALPLIAPERMVYSYIDIPREVVYARIDQRFDQMMKAGALEEVEALISLLQAKQSNPGALLDGAGLFHAVRKSGIPLLKSCGFPELCAYLDGEMTLEEATAKAQQHSRNYAKRQLTWIRNQLPESALAIPHEWQEKAEEIVPVLRKIIDR